MTSGLNSCNRRKYRKSMVTWHGLEGDVMGKKGGQKQLWEYLSFISGWPCLSSFECRQTAYCEQREEASGRSVSALQCTSLRTLHWPLWPGCVLLQNFPYTSLLLKFLLHMTEWLLKLGCPGSNPNSPLT